MWSQAHGEHAGAAMRRRQRRLRQWLRHELAETSHHAAPRGQTKARAGVRPGVLEDPGPRRETEPVTYGAPRGPKPPSPGEPSLAVPLLAGTAGEVVDARTLSFFLAQSVSARKKEEEEKEKKMSVHEEAAATLERARLWAEHACRRRKRKKRRKRRTPRTPSHCSQSRARRRQRRWHAPGWFSSVHAVFAKQAMTLRLSACVLLPRPAVQALVLAGG